MRHFLITLERFWKRWRAEYLLELREFHRVQNPDKNSGNTVKEGEIVTIFDDTHPRVLWRLGKVESVIHSSDGGVRGALIRTQTKSGSSTILRRPIQHLYPLDVCSPTQRSISATTSNRIGEQSESTQDSHESTQDSHESTQDSHESTQDSHESTDSSGSNPNRLGRSQRRAATQARDRILGLSVMDEV